MTESATSSAESTDPLANASCLTCGYSLRGLPENRCPACGRPFKPAEFIRPYVPLWPSLLIWYLLSSTFELLLSLSDTVKMLGFWLSTGGPLGPDASYMRLLSFYSPSSVLAIAKVLNATTLLPLGIVAIWGLHRRRDWGRKVCIVCLAIVCVDRIITSVLFRELQAVVMLPYHYDHPMYIQFASNAVAHLLSLLLTAWLMIFLATGLRRRSLIGRGEASCPLRMHNVAGHRDDWLLLMTLLLLGIGLIRMPQDLYSLWVTWILLPPAGFRSFLDACDAAKSLLGVIAPATAIAAAILTWRKPKRVYVMVSLVALSAMVHWVATGLTISMASLPEIGLALPRIRFAPAVNLLCPVILPLGLAYFAFRFLRGKELELVAR